MTSAVLSEDMELTAKNIGMFKELLYERCHLSVPESREMLLRRWITQFAEEGKYRSVNDYYRALMEDRREFERLVSMITTRETYFFRMPAQFEALRDVVIPELVDREGRASMKALSGGTPHRMRLRAWSSGCATGQEAYSLAMQILESLRYPKAWDVKVLGTDINRDAIDLAKLGRYDSQRLGKTPSSFVERYFTVCTPQEIVVSDEVKEITEFRMLNLRDLPGEESLKNSFDIIFCRNVMIYFDLAAQQRLVSALSACLVPGGCLFTGEGEVLHLYDHSLEVLERGEAVYYRKKAEE